MVDALLFTKGDIEYQVRPLTRSLRSKLAQRFSYDYPQLELMRWDAEDPSSLEKCFDGCYGAFVDSGILLSGDASMKEWTRAELKQGEQFQEAAEVSFFPSLLTRKYLGEELN